MIEELRVTDKYASLYLSAQESDTKTKPINRIKSIDSKLFYERLKKTVNENRLPAHTVLPPNCRYIKELSDGSVRLVIEDPPAIRTIKANVGLGHWLQELDAWGVRRDWGYDEGIYSTMKFTFAFPYIIYILTYGSSNELHSASVFFRPLPLKGLGDGLYIPNLFNISLGSRCSMCLGDGVRGALPTLTEAVQSTLHLFWNNTYNNDYSDCVNKYNREKLPYLRNWFEWEHYTKEDPMFIYKVKWLPYGSSLGQIINRQNKTKLENSSMIKSAHDMMKKVFYDGDRDNNNNELLSNVAHSYQISSDAIIKIGDVIKYNKKDYRVIDFLSNKFQPYTVSHIKTVEEKTNKIELIPLTIENKQNIEKAILERKKEARIKIGKTTLKIDDIVVYKRQSGESKQYRKIKDIVFFEDQAELLLGSEYVIPSNLQEIKKFVVSKPKYKGIELVKDKKILISHQPNTRQNQCLGGLYGYTELTYKSYDVTQNGELVYNFTDSGARQTIQINPNNDNRKLIEDDKVKAPEVFRFLNSLYLVDRACKDETFFTREGIIYPSTKTSIINCSYQESIKHCLKKDHVSFKSFDYDWRFDIGDRVVVADWQTPTNMLRIKLVIGFKKETPNHDGHGKISIILQDKNGSLSEETIYDSQKNYLSIGKIRKIANKYKNLTSGMKIKAKKGGIANFPKKDTNIIIGFLTDTRLDTPLVLCSNCCTLWADEIEENFDIIKMKSKQWKALEHAPIQLSKIKYQTGDMVEITSGSFAASHNYVICNTDEWTSSLKALNISQFRTRTDYFIVDPYFKANMIRYGFIEPRLSAAEARNSLKVSAIPNFHGAYIKTNNVNVQFMVKDERRLI